jgi:hypothetical protein
MLAWLKPSEQDLGSGIATTYENKHETPGGILRAFEAGQWVAPAILNGRVP